jgi:chromosome segregation ATPase
MSEKDTEWTCFACVADADEQSARELAELRAALAKERERAEKAEADTLWRRRENLLDKEQRDLAGSALVAVERDLKITGLERDALRAECERLKAELEDLKDAYAEYTEERQGSHKTILGLKATLVEREARITSLQTELNHEMGKDDLLREELGEREAELERLKERLDEARGAFIDERADFNLAIKERDEARAALAKIRDWLEYESQLAEDREDSDAMCAYDKTADFVRGLILPASPSPSAPARPDPQDGST